MSIAIDDDGLTVEIDAPFHGDPAPPTPVGPTDGLWDFEVVELFLLGDDSKYLELEFSPHGHYLGIQLEGVRQPVRTMIPFEFEAQIDWTVWHGEAKIPSALLPGGLDRWNAYAIHGQGVDRAYLAAFPVPGPQPDFHRLECFGPLVFGVH